MADDFDLTYVPYFKEAPLDTTFNSRFKGTLVQSLDQLEDILRPHTGVKVAVDTETKGLDFSMPKPLVGISFSFTPRDGFYIPLRHVIGRNLEMHQVFPLMQDFLLRNMLLMYNSPFDLLMMQAENFDVMNFRVFDVQTLVFNSDTNVARNNLKWAARHYLGREVPTFEETVGKDSRFDYISPDEAYFYACCDTGNTFGLADKLLPHIQKECPEVLKIDNALQKSMVYFLSNVITLDNKTMKVMEAEVASEIKTVEKSIFRTVGYPFRLDSNRDIATALLTLGLDTGIKTTKGDMKVDEHSLSKLHHPVIKDIINRNSLVKQLGSYISKLAAVDKGRIQFMTCRVPTGRFASGNKDNPYFLRINGQNLTKSETAYYEVNECDLKDPEGILGFKFTELLGSSDEVKLVMKDKTKFFAESMTGSQNVRRAFTVPDNNHRDWVFVSIDFSMEELMVAGMLSNEPVMMRAFEAGEDLHKVTAMTMFGADNYNKDKRKIAKICNFGLLYGGTGYTLAKASGLTVMECDMHAKKYWETMSVLNRWRKQQVSLCMQRGGNVYTAFGRPRRLAYYLGHSEKQKQSFGQRSVVSHIVQGTCGDVMRIVLVKLFRDFFRIYTEDLRFVNAVHDEVDFCVRRESFNELVPKIQEVMEILIPGCRLKLKTDVSVGHNYGQVFSFHQKDGRWVPKPA